MRCTLHGRCTEKCRETVGSGDVFAYSAHLLRRGSMPRAIADPSQTALKSTNKLNLPKRSAASILKTDRQDRSSAVGERALSVWGLGFRADLQQRRSKCSSFVSDEQTFKKTSVFQETRTNTNKQTNKRSIETVYMWRTESLRRYRFTSRIPSSEMLGQPPSFKSVIPLQARASSLMPANVRSHRRTRSAVLS